MSKPSIAQKGPYAVDVEEGKKYFWCACGLSQKQPFCDGSHKSTGFACVPYTAEATKKYISVAVKIAQTVYFAMAVTTSFK